MTIAESLIAEDRTKLRVVYVRVGKISDVTPYHPCSYSMYEIRQSCDTVTINVIFYNTGIVYTNGRAENIGWCGWKTLLPNT